MANSFKGQEISAFFYPRSKSRSQKFTLHPIRHQMLCMCQTRAEMKQEVAVELSAASFLTLLRSHFLQTKYVLLFC